MSLPMIPRAQDMKDLVNDQICLLLPPATKLCVFWKEKLTRPWTFWGIPLLGVTGILLWALNISSHVLPGWVLNMPIPHI
jgi:hypothetical protein